MVEILRVDSPMLTLRQLWISILRQPWLSIDDCSLRPCGQQTELSGPKQDATVSVITQPIACRQ